MRLTSITILLVGLAFGSALAQTGGYGAGGGGAISPSELGGAPGANGSSYYGAGGHPGAGNGDSYYVDGPPAPNLPDDAVLRAFELKNLPSHQAQQTLTQMYPDKVGKSVVVATNGQTLVVRGSEKDLELIFELVTQLDVSFMQPPSVQSLPTQVSDLEANVERQPQLETAYENRIRNLAIIYHSTPSDQKEKSAEIRGGLKNSLEELFQARQKRQREQVVSLRRRVAELEQKVEERDKTRSEIVRKRLAALLSEDWEAVEKGPATPAWAVSEIAAKHAIQDELVRKGRLDAASQLRATSSGLENVLSVRELKESIEKRELDVEEAKLKYDLAKANSEETRQLSNDNATSKSNLRKAMYEARLKYVAYKRTRSELESARAKLALVEGSENPTLVQEREGDVDVDVIGSRAAP